MDAGGALIEISFLKTLWAARSSAAFHGGFLAVTLSCLGSATVGFQGGIMTSGGREGAEGSGAALLSEETGLTLTGGEDLGVLAVTEPSRGGCSTSAELGAGLFLLFAQAFPIVVDGAEA